MAGRTAIDEASIEYIDGIVSAFERRYERAVVEVQACWSLADALGPLLRRKIDTPAPVRMTGTGTGDESAADATATRIGHLLDDLDGAIRFAQNIGTLRVRTAHLERTNQLSGFSPEAVYRVVRSFNDPLTGLAFEPGSLIDSSLVAPAMLVRLHRVKYLCISDRAASAA